MYYKQTNKRILYCMKVYHIKHALDGNLFAYFIKQGELDKVLHKYKNSACEIVNALNHCFPGCVSSTHSNSFNNNEKCIYPASNVLTTLNGLITVILARSQVNPKGGVTPKQLFMIASLQLPSNHLQTGVGVLWNVCKNKTPLRFYKNVTTSCSILISAIKHYLFQFHPEIHTISLNVDTQSKFYDNAVSAYLKAGFQPVPDKPPLGINQLNWFSNSSRYLRMDTTLTHCGIC